MAFLNVVRSSSRLLDIDRRPVSVVSVWADELGFDCTLARDSFHECDFHFVRRVVID